MRSIESAVRSIPRGHQARLHGRILPQAEVDANLRGAMFRLFAAHFAGADRRTFEADLSEKQWAILLEDDGGALRGFSTLAFYETAAGGRLVSVVYSGDTIVERGWWGSPALARTWIRAVRQNAGCAKGSELYWFLLTSGFRTYRFLPVFFQSFYPRCDGGCAVLQPLLDAIATQRFGPRYDAASQVVRFERPQVLASDLLALPEGRTLDPHIAYFLSRNPGHWRGDELACLAPVADDNLTAAARRMQREAPEHR